MAGGVTVVVVAAGEIRTQYKELTASSELDLEDIHFSEPEPSDGYSVSTLDITLRNGGEETAYVKRADLTVKKIWTLMPPYVSDSNKCPPPSFVSPSHTYHVTLPIKDDAPYTVSEGLSQSIEPNGIDQFDIRVSEDVSERANKDVGREYVLLTTVSLVYDEDDKTLAKGVLLAEGLSPGYSYNQDGCSKLREDLDESTAARVEAQNKQIVEEIEDLKALQNHYLKYLVQSVSKAKP